GTSAIISGFHPEGVLTRDVSTAKKYKGRPWEWLLGFNRKKQLDNTLFFNILFVSKETTYYYFPLVSELRFVPVVSRELPSVKYKSNSFHTSNKKTAR
ncbi:MAG TPA: hypothetical protein VKX31_05435, partial [Brumimicrobium sp.]|nr:hypothetical protein [Brumimicrobium sp.]